MTAAIPLWCSCPLAGSTSATTTAALEGDQAKRRNQPGVSAHQPFNATTSYNPSFQQRHFLPAFSKSSSNLRAFCSLYFLNYHANSDMDCLWCWSICADAQFLSATR